MSSLQELDQLDMVSEFEHMATVLTAAGIKPVSIVQKDLTPDNFYDVVADAGLYVDELDNELDAVARNPGYIEHMKQAYKMDDDHRTVGQLLGYPGCCVDYFVRAQSLPVEERDQHIRIAYYLSQGHYVPVYGLLYQHCNHCLTDRDSPSGQLEQKLEEILQEHLPQLYDTYAALTGSEHTIRTDEDGSQVASIFNGHTLGDDVVVPDELPAGVRL